LLTERRAEEWHFDEGLLSSRIALLNGEGENCRGHAANAKNQAAVLRDAAEQEAAHLCAGVEEKERRCQERISNMRGELVEVESLIEQMREECEQQVLEIRREILAERTRSAAIEQAASDERKKLEDARQRIADIERSEDVELSIRETRIREYRQVAQQEVLRLQREAQQQAHELERNNRDKVDALHRRLADVRQRTDQDVAIQVSQRDETRSEADRKIADVDAKVAAGFNETLESTIGVQQTSQAKISQIQETDFAHEARLQDRIDDALLAASRCVDEAAHVRVLEDKNGKMRDAAATSLGRDAFTKSTQFNVLFNYGLDRKLNASLAIVAGER
jgi:hypothetical protein